MMGETGVFIRRNSKGRLVATLKGKLDFENVLISGRESDPLSSQAAEQANAEIRKILKGAVKPAKGASRKARGELEPSAEYLYSTMS